MTYKGFTDARKEANERYRQTQDFFRLRLRPGMREQIKREAERQKKSMNELIIEAVLQYLNGKSIE